jgi:pSer/pThr/pTyr-binding forkhead associated (FHA) protein
VTQPDNIEIHLIRDLTEKLQGYGEDIFRNLHPYPFMVVIHKPPEDHEWIDPRTAESKVSDIVGLGKLSKSMEAVAVVKSNRNAFKSVITVGRARNNDIVLRAPKISKLHAQFILDEAGYLLADMDSANGTMVNGAQLEKNQQVRLEGGDQIAFWKYIFEFYDLDSFIDLLRKPR